VMNKEEQKQVVTAAQIALGEKYAAPFWDDVTRELDKLDPKATVKQSLTVAPRLTKPS